MAIRVVCNSPHGLLEEIRGGIAKKSIVTWSVDADGDFTHTPPQWQSKAWLRPKIETNELVFNTLGPKGTKITTEVYAIYHGRFIEMLLVHFDKKFSRAYASALPETGDRLGGT